MVSFSDAVVTTLRTNGPERFYMFHRRSFRDVGGPHYYTPDELCSLAMANAAGIVPDFEVVEMAGLANILQGPLLAFSPMPIYSQVTQVGVEPRYRWTFNSEDIYDQLDWIRTEFGVRLLMGPVLDSAGGWIAHFVDETGDRGRVVHSVGRTAKFFGKSPEEALWLAIHDIRVVNPHRPAAASLR